MGCDAYEVGAKIEAISGFEVQETLAAPVPPMSYPIQAGDTGEVTDRRMVRNTHWLRVKWDRLNRTLNLNQSQFEFVKLS